MQESDSFCSLGKGTSRNICSSSFSVIQFVVDSSLWQETFGWKSTWEERSERYQLEVSVPSLKNSILVEEEKTQTKPPHPGCVSSL